jgi:uncharacterized delta-60 repeat protein
MLLAVACDGGGDPVDDTDTVDDTTDTDVLPFGTIEGLSDFFVPHAILPVADGLRVAGELNGDMAVVALNADLTLNTAWGEGGVVAYDFGGDPSGLLPADVDVAADVAAWGDGLLIAGVARDFFTGGDGNFGLARLHADGTLDTSFSEDGKVVTDWTVPSIAQRLQITDAGPVAWGMISNSIATGYDVASVRYDASGAPDPTWGEGGGLVLNDPRETSSAMMIALGGDVVVGGEAFDARRVLASGLVDGAFGVAGELYLPDCRLDQGLELPDGNLLFAGTTLVTVGEEEVGALRLVRTDANGQLDATFGDGGIIDVVSPIETVSFGAIELPGSVNKVRGLGVASDGAIVAYTQALTLTGTAPLLLKLTADGALDATFGVEGAYPLDGAFGLFEGIGAAIDHTLWMDGDDAVIIDSVLYDAPGGDIGQAPIAVRVPIGG